MKDMKELEHCSVGDADAIIQIIDDALTRNLEVIDPAKRRRIRRAIIKALAKRRYYIAYGILIRKDRDHKGNREVETRGY